MQTERPLCRKRIAKALAGPTFSDTKGTPILSPKLKRISTKGSKHLIPKPAIAIIITYRGLLSLNSFRHRRNRRDIDSIWHHSDYFLLGSSNSGFLLQHARRRTLLQLLWGSLLASLRLPLGIMRHLAISCDGLELLIVAYRRFPLLNDFGRGVEV